LKEEEEEYILHVYSGKPRRKPRQYSRKREKRGSICPHAPSIPLQDDSRGGRRLQLRTLASWHFFIVDPQNAKSGNDSPVVSNSPKQTPRSRRKYLGGGGRRMMIQPMLTTQPSPSLFFFSAPYLLVFGGSLHQFHFLNITQNLMETLWRLHERTLGGIKLSSRSWTCEPTH